MSTCPPISASIPRAPGRADPGPGLFLFAGSPGSREHSPPTQHLRLWTRWHPRHPSQQCRSIPGHFRELGITGLSGRPIEAGEWSVEIDVHRILPPGGVSYRIEIVQHAEELEGPTGDVAPAMTEGGRRRGPGWYSGDLHGHTIHPTASSAPPNTSITRWTGGMISWP